MSDTISSLAQQHDVKVRYKVLVVDTKNKTDHYLDLDLSEQQVRNFVKNNAKTLEDCTVIGFSNLRTADSESVTVFKESSTKVAEQPKPVIDKEAQKKAKDKLRKLLSGYQP
jgi:hypothetical protein